MLVFIICGCIPGNPAQLQPSPEILSATPFADQKPVEILNQAIYQQILANDYTTIASIQGAEHISPLNRKTISDVLGVITVKRADGFYMQSPFPDDNPKTSEGIFVFLKKPPQYEIGDWVFVSGKVSEFYPGGIETGNLPITEIDNPRVIRISANNLLPAATAMGENSYKNPTEIIDDDQKRTFDMEDGLDFYESLESMLVQVNDAIVIGPSSSYNEFVVLANGGQDATGVNPRGGITISESDFNPERIMVDDGLSALPQVNVGDSFTSPIVGILDYSFGNYKIQVTNKIEVKPGNLPPDLASELLDGEVAIASMNVENLSAANRSERFSRLAEIIIQNLKSPDIIALQEVQDDNGALDDKETSARATYQKITEAILKNGGPQYEYVEIAPERNKDGGQPGGNIRVSFLYRTDRGVSFVKSEEGGINLPAEFLEETGEIHLRFNPARVDPLNYVFVDSRKSLVAEFMYNGEKIFIINNHWVSKGGDTPLFGSSQPPLLLSENQRLGQARSIAEFVNSALMLEQNIHMIVLGDLNDFYFSRPVRELEKTGMINLFFNLPIEERYTYNYEGNAQNLDNVLVSPHLNMLIKQVEVIHINSEYAYGQRFSDHDPIRFVLNLR